MLSLHEIPCRVSCYHPSYPGCSLPAPLEVDLLSDTSTELLPLKIPCMQLWSDRLQDSTALRTLTEEVKELP